MKRFKKLVSVLTLTAMLAASLTACGGKDPVAAQQAQPLPTAVQLPQRLLVTAHLPMPSPGTLQRLSMLLQHLTVGDYLL